MSNQVAKSSKDFFAMPNVKAKLTHRLRCSPISHRDHQEVISCSYLIARAS